MRKWCSLLMVSLMAIVLVGCKSKEEKALETIKSELFKTLYDFDSYQPIETVVSEAKQTPLNDYECWSRAEILSTAIHNVSGYLDLAKDAKENKEYWSSNYYVSDFVKEYKEKYTKYAEKANELVEICNSVAKEINDIMSNFNSSENIGWNVKHTFRCKTKGGISEIVHYRYVLSKDFKSVILRENLESDDDKMTRNVIENVLPDWEDFPQIPVEL